MSTQTKIEWCDSTFNPWIGCTKVSQACDHCYAAISTPARSLGVQWGAKQPRRRTSAANWKQPLRWERLDRAMFHAWNSFKANNPGLTDEELIDRGFYKPRRRRVFCASLADVFDNEVNPTWRRDLFELILLTPHLDWLLLTKRIGNVIPMLKEHLHLARYETEWRLFKEWKDGKPPANVWLGATICNQVEADRDISKLLETPAAVRFVSMEPLLGPVNLRHIRRVDHRDWRGDPENPDVWTYIDDALTGFHAHKCGGSYGAKLDWVIVGGESGHGARPMHPDWARSLRDQCASAGVPFLFKQWGQWWPTSQDLERSNTYYDDPKAIGCWVRQCGSGSHRGQALADFKDGDAHMLLLSKKTAGRLLDGAQHDGFPEARR